MFKNRTLLIIALIALVNMLGYGIVIPILYGYSKRFGLTDFQNGLLFALFSLCSFFSAPVIGRLSDKYGRRPLLLISIVGTALSFIVMAFAQNGLWLALARALDGITAGNIPVAFAVISDTTKPEDRPRAFGLVGSAFSFGFVFGPAISGFTVGISQSLPFLIAAGVTIVAIIMTALYLPETNEHMGEVKEGKLYDFSKLWHTLFDPNVGITFLVSFIISFAFACAIIYGFQPFTLKLLKLTLTQNAMLFTVFGIVGLIAQNFIVHRTAKMFGVKRAFSIGTFFTGLALVIMYFSRTLALFMTAAVIMGVFNSIVQTLIPAILSQEADAKSQGSVMGLNSSYQSIGMIFGPILGGIVATVSIPMPFIVGAGFIFLCFILSFGIMNSTAKPVSEF